MKKEQKQTESGANVNNVNKLKVLLLTAQMQMAQRLEPCC